MDCFTLRVRNDVRDNLNCTQSLRGIKSAVNFSPDRCGSFCISRSMHYLWGGIEALETMKEKQSEKSRRQQKKLPKKGAGREHRVAFMLNDTEYNAIERYLRKYKIMNKSNWYRRTILSHIWRVMEEDYPTLFNENEMRR
jgi:hypothetical protein